MSTTVRKTPKGSPWIQDSKDRPYDLNVLFWLWLRHPEIRVRERTNSLLSKLEEKADPWHSNEKIQEVLQNTKGTVLDPFSLSEDLVIAATRFVRIAMSEQFQQPRVRIISETTIGVAGGLVLNQELHRQYYPRSILEGKRRTPWDLWYFAPGELACAEVVPFEIREGVCGPLGASFILLALEMSSEDQSAGWRGRGLSREFQENSTLGGHSLTELGIRIERHKGGMKVVANTPESMIRSAAAITRSAFLEISEGDTEEDVTWTSILPNPLPQKEYTVPVFIGHALGGGRPPWMCADVEVSAPSDLVADARPHIFLPSSWITLDSMEKILETV